MMKRSDITKATRLVTLAEARATRARVQLTIADAELSKARTALDTALRDFNAGPKRFAVALESLGTNKIQVIKAIREVTNLGLKEAMDITNAAPTFVTRDIDEMGANYMQRVLTAAGATVRLDAVKP